MTKFWLHEDMQHLHSGGMLSLKPALLYTSSQPPFPIHFLLLPLIPSIKLLKSLYFRTFTWFVNYANDCVVGLEFWSSVALSAAHTGFPQLIPVSAAKPGFRNCFIKKHVPGVLWEEEPHGQVRGTKDMVCVLLAHPNRS